jgi:hypothetical protein
VLAARYRNVGQNVLKFRHRGAGGPAAWPARCPPNRADGPLPSPEPRHGVVELLRLVSAVRRLAFDRNLPPSEALGRIRDAYHDYDRPSQS